MVESNVKLVLKRKWSSTFNKCHHARTVFDSCPESEGTGVCLTHGQLVNVPGRRDSLLDVNAGLAQLVERNLAKVQVESSSLLARSSFSEAQKPHAFISPKCVQRLILALHDDGTEVREDLCGCVVVVT